MSVDYYSFLHSVDRKPSFKLDMDLSEIPNVLKPLSALEWDELPSLPVEMYNTQAVFLNGTVFVGGGSTYSDVDDDNLYWFKPRPGSNDCWTSIPTPTFLYALTSYNSHPLLVGGIDCQSNKASNSTYFVRDELIVKGLPPLRRERFSASVVSSGSLIAVAGGRNGDETLSSVEIYVKDDNEWIIGHSLPVGLYEMKSLLIQDEWYLLGGSEQYTEVYRISLKSLLSKNSQPSSWTSIANVPYELSAVAACGGFALSVGGENGDKCETVSSICAYIPGILSWQKVGELNIPLQNTCAISLPTGELMVIGGEDKGALLSRRVFKAIVEDPCRKMTEIDSIQQLIPPLEIENQKLQNENKHKQDTIEQLSEQLELANLRVSSAVIEHKKEVQQLNREHKVKVQQLNKVQQLDRKHNDKMQQLQSENKCLYHQLELALSAPIKPKASYALLDLPGVDVLNVIIVEVTNSKLDFEWCGYGFKLHIPENSLPPGMSRCLLQITTSLTGQYQFPEGHELASAVYWVRCEPLCEFQNLLTVDMYHCAKMTGTTNLKFVKAVCSPQGLPYAFKEMDGSFSFENSSHYGSLKLDSFSAYGVTGKDIEREYVAFLYYLERNFYTREIHFVVSWNDEAHITEVKNHYKSKGAKEGSHLHIEFKDDKISLNIPIQGVSVKEWKLTPLATPTLTQKAVDVFKPGREIPSSELIATLSPNRTKLVQNRLYLVTLEGAKEPCNQMQIEIDSFNPRIQGLKYTSLGVLYWIIPLAMVICVVMSLFLLSKGTCDVLPPLSDGTISYTPDRSGPNCILGSTASHICDKGFVLDGAPTRECVSWWWIFYSKWTSESPICQRDAQTSSQFLNDNINIHNVNELYSVLHEIGDWEGLCLNLGVNPSIISELLHTQLELVIKRRRCLTAYYNTGEANWYDVMVAVSEPPIYNERVAKAIASKYNVHNWLKKDEL